MIKDNPLSKTELVLIIILVGFGSWSIPAWGNWGQETYLENKYLYVFANFVLSSLIFWTTISFIKVPKHLRLPGSLWAAASWNAWFPSLLAYIGFFLLPIEIILAGLLLSFRSNLTTWKAVGISALTKLLVLIMIQPSYLMDLLT